MTYVTSPLVSRYYHFLSGFSSDADDGGKNFRDEIFDLLKESAWEHYYYSRTP